MTEKKTNPSAREKRLAKEENESIEVHGRSFAGMAAGAAISFIPVVGPWIGIPLIWGGIGAHVVQSRKDKKREEECRQQMMKKEEVVEQLLLNINTAADDDLQQLLGIDPMLSKQLIAARPFHSTEDILAVKGLPKTVIDYLSQFRVD